MATDTKRGNTFYGGSQLASTWAIPPTGSKSQHVDHDGGGHNHPSRGPDARADDSHFSYYTRKHVHHLGELRRSDSVNVREIWKQALNRNEEAVPTEPRQQEPPPPNPNPAPEAPPQKMKKPKPKPETKTKKKRDVPAPLLEPVGPGNGASKDEAPAAEVVPGPRPPPSPPGQRKLRLSPRGSAAKPALLGGAISVSANRRKKKAGMRRRSEFLREQREGAFGAAVHRDRRASMARITTAAALLGIAHPPVHVELRGPSFVYRLAQQPGAPPRMSERFSLHALDVKPLTRSGDPNLGHICLGVKRAIKLQHDADFKLFLAHEGETIRPLRDEMPVADLRAELAEFGQHRVVYSINLHVPGDAFDQEAAAADSPRSAHCSAHYLTYTAALRHLAMRNYRLPPTLEQGLALLALLLQGEGGDWGGLDGDDTYRWCLAHFGPRPTSPPDVHVAALKEKHRELTGMPALKAQRTFLKILKAECPHYGSRFFQATFRVKSDVPFFFHGASAQNLLKQCTVGINFSGIHIIENSNARDGTSNVISHDMRKLKKWTTSADGGIFCYVLQEDENAQQTFIYLTELRNASGRQMQDLVESYISAAEEKRQNLTRQTSRVFEEAHASTPPMMTPGSAIKEGEENGEGEMGEEQADEDGALQQSDGAPRGDDDAKRRSQALAQQEALLQQVQDLTQSLGEKADEVDSLRAAVERLRNANAEQQRHFQNRLRADNIKAQEERKEQEGHEEERRRVAQELQASKDEVRQLRDLIATEANEHLEAYESLDRSIANTSNKVTSALQSAVAVLEWAQHSPHSSPQRSGSPVLQRLALAQDAVERLDGDVKSTVTPTRRAAAAART